VFDVQILPSAWEDLKQIEDWYVLEFDVESAIKVGNSIFNAIERLAQFPDSGSLTPDEWLNKQGYRMIICQESHVAIYRHVGDVVYVYHIADTRANYTKLFRS